ncbi:putative aldouronate transport system permease protein [Paenibacillus taihuensis]|uniref:Putative aldouronate transport system permease protein n=1 Tax=Paenibacillus taihuensis TaxID=1156355 RepID=A0A3D9SEW1_9BACL|nr:putative aldouronate transport system permease protein [Paenibacillus taihuensis]
MISYWRKTWPFHLLLLPAIVLCIIFSYIPMTGIIIAFEDYQPWVGMKNSPWVGFDQFHYLFTYPDGKQIIWNTLLIAFFKLLFNLVIPIVFALLLNEVRKVVFKRVVQTLVYLPHFLSWVILGGILIDILSTEGGIVNRVLESFGVHDIFFLGNGQWFRFTVIVSDVWKEFGFSAIIFLATLVGIDPSLYEAAEIDGATRWQQVMSITVPLMMPIVIVVATLSLGRILDAGFDQILNIYNPLVYSHGDIIDTFAYREGLNNAQFSFGTAVGVFKSVVGLVLIIISYRLAYKWANYRIF